MTKLQNGPCWKIQAIFSGECGDWGPLLDVLSCLHGQSSEMGFCNDRVHCWWAFLNYEKR